MMVANDLHVRFRLAIHSRTDGLSESAVKKTTGNWHS